MGYFKVGAWVLMAVLMAGVSYGAGTSSSSMQSNNPQTSETSLSFYDQGLTADKRGDYASAVEFFKKALEQDNNNADVLNMLAHSERKSGLLDEAIEHYKMALKIRPDFSEAHEYLGEAYVQAAMEEVETLKKYGSKSDEDLEELTKEFKEAASHL